MKKKIIGILGIFLMSSSACMSALGNPSLEEWTTTFDEKDQEIFAFNQQITDGEYITRESTNNLVHVYRGYENRYAVIVEGPSGSSYLYYYYTRDVARLYNVLRDNYSFSDEEIFVLFALENYDPHDEFDPSIIDYNSTESNLQLVLNMFKEGGEKEMNDNDFLFLCWIGHGGNSGGSTYFPLAIGDVYDYEFAGYAEGISGSLVFVFQPCNSGGFIKDVSGLNRIVLSSVNEYESEGGWIRLFYQGLRGEADEDLEIGNQDGYASLEEVHHYAARYVYEREGVHSLLDDNSDAVGHHYTSNEYDPDDPMKDAYIAARTFLTHYGLFADANGPYYGLIDEQVQFTGSAIGGYVPYSWMWDFGDGNSSNLQNPTHTYVNSDNYTVTLTVTDNESNTIEDVTWAWIQDGNNPPDAPLIDGLSRGNPGITYDYKFTGFDSDGSVIYLFVDWDDESNSGWIGPYDSGQEITFSHTWLQQGIYNIKCKARDPYEAESSLSEFEINIPRNKVTTGSLFHWFLERFLMLERWL